MKSVSKEGRISGYEFKALSFLSGFPWIILIEQILSDFCSWQQNEDFSSYMFSGFGLWHSLEMWLCLVHSL